MTQEVLSILQNLLLPTEVGDNIVLPYLLFVRFILICHASSPSCQDTHQSPNIKKKKHLIPMLSTQNCFSFYCMILRILIPGVFSILSRLFSTCYLSSCAIIPLRQCVALVSKCFLTINFHAENGDTGTGSGADLNAEQPFVLSGWDSGPGLQVGAVSVLQFQNKLTSTLETRAAKSTLLRNAFS